MWELDVMQFMALLLFLYHFWILTPQAVLIMLWFHIQYYARRG